MVNSSKYWKIWASRDVVPCYEYWKNGKMERVFRTLQGRMHAMLTAAQLPLMYWGEAALTASFLFNLTTSSTLPNGITPFEALRTSKPDVSHLRTWGVHCFAHVPVELQTKLGHKSVECLFMGYPPSGRGYHVCSLAMNHFFDSGNVIFDENIPYHALLHRPRAGPGQGRPIFGGPWPCQWPSGSGQSLLALSPGRLGPGPVGPGQGRP